jgi:lipopolysaccharide/colanic/teichoic acid biosynthesis glycosyltransferase
MSAGPIPKTGSVVPPLSESAIYRKSQMHATAQPFKPRNQWYLPLKFVIELVAAAVLLVVTLPVVLLAVIGVKLTSRGPAFFYQTRIGKDNKEFTLIKLRTMVHNAEVLTGPVWSKPNDSRVTRFGNFLRDTHIDEFPQLINVLKGEMSLIGPRPERPEFVSKLQFQYPHYLDRSNVRPGITGLAQLKLPPDYHIDDVRHKLAFDVYYVENVGPVLDSRIVLFTVNRMIAELIFFGWRCIRLPSKEIVDRLYQSRNVNEFDEPIEHRDD